MGKMLSSMAKREREKGHIKDMERRRTAMTHKGLGRGGKQEQARLIEHRHQHVCNVFNRPT